MEVLEAYDLTKSFRSAALLWEVDHHTVARAVAARALGAELADKPAVRSTGAESSPTRSLSGSSAPAVGSAPMCARRAVPDGGDLGRLRRLRHRAGLPQVGAQRLRHSGATGAPSRASLAEIGQVLRHRRVGTTAIYAKVDQAPWASSPGLARDGVMTALSAQVGDYLSAGRSATKLARAENLLGQFVAHCETVGAGTVTTEVAVAWARMSVDGSTWW